MVTVDMLYASSPLLVLFSYLETLPWTIAWINPVSASSWILLWAPLKPSSVCHLTFLCPLSTPARHGHYLFPTFLTDFPSCFESCSKYLVLFFCVSPSGSAHWLPWNSMNVGWLKGKTVMSTRQLSFFFFNWMLIVSQNHDKSFAMQYLTHDNNILGSRLCSFYSGGNWNSLTR